MPFVREWGCGHNRWPLDYHECEDAETLVRILNEIVQSGFFLEKIIPQSNGTFVVMFRRHDFG